MWKENMYGKIYKAMTLEVTSDIAEEMDDQ